MAIMKLLMVLGFGNRMILPLMGLFSSFLAIRWNGVSFLLLSTDNGVINDDLL